MGVLKFEHRSHNYEGSWPEHTGYVLHAKENLFFIGMKENTIRLSISEKPNESEKSKAYMCGLVLSVRSRFPFDPFAARFLMLPEENTELLKKLLDKSPVPSGGETDKLSTVREEVFFEITKGRYNYLMLAMHSRL